MTAEGPANRGRGLFQFCPPLPLWLAIGVARRENVLFSWMQTKGRWEEFIKMHWHLRSKLRVKVDPAEWLSQGSTGTGIQQGKCGRAGQAGRQVAPYLPQESAVSWMCGWWQVCLGAGSTCLPTGTTLVWVSATRISLGTKSEEFPGEPLKTSVFFFYSSYTNFEKLKDISKNRSLNTSFY